MALVWKISRGTGDSSVGHILTLSGKGGVGGGENTSIHEYIRVY